MLLSYKAKEVTCNKQQKLIVIEIHWYKF
jgi:hypothetical protein